MRLKVLKYLGFFEQKISGFNKKVKHRIKCREVSGILCDMKIPIKLKGKFDKSVVRPTMLYDSECWAVDKEIK